MAGESGSADMRKCQLSSLSPRSQMSSHKPSFNREHFKCGTEFLWTVFYSFIFKVHLHMTKYFLLAKEEFQETSIFGKRSERKKIISKCQRLTYQKTFEATWHFFKQEKQLDFSRIWNDHNEQNIILPPKMQSPLATTSCTEGGLRDWCQTSFL